MKEISYENLLRCFPLSDSKSIFVTTIHDRDFLASVNWTAGKISEWPPIANISAVCWPSEVPLLRASSSQIDWAASSENAGSAIDLVANVGPFAAEHRLEYAEARCALFCIIACAHFSASTLLLKPLIYSFAPSAQWTRNCHSSPIC
jgi:hypothetical protein